MDVEYGKPANLLPPSFLPRPRLKPENIAAGRNTCGPPRRKPSADQTSLTDHGSAPQIKRRVSCRRPLLTSRTIFESTLILSTKPTTVPTGVIGDERVALIEHTRAGATSRTSTPNLSESSTISRPRPFQNENTSPRKAGEPIYNKAISAHLSWSASSILNVGSFNVAIRNATQTSLYLSINTLDDHTRWDMDPLPSIPSPSGNPGAPQVSATTPSGLRNPFSTPFDDDTSFENDMPLLLNRQSKVVLEDMGIKKTKKKAQGNLPVGSNILNRHSKIESPTPPPQKSLPDLPQPLPQPLPLRTLCQNSQSHRPLPTPPPLTSIKMKLTPEVKAPTGPSSSKKDALGCTHLGASDCELIIAFPQSSHFEVWDMGDDSHIAIPGILCLMAKDAPSWTGMPLALPDVSFIDIHCNSIPVRVRMTSYNPSQEYSTQYQGPHLSSPGVKDGPDTISDTRPPSMSHDRITLERHWIRTYSRPGVDGSGRARIVRRGEIADAYARAASGAGFGTDARGWYLKFWIPLPTRLFVKRETRMFQLDARVWMMGDEERALSLDENADGRVAPLVADAQMTVSHLRAPREMDGVWWC